MAAYLSQAGINNAQGILAAQGAHAMYGYLQTQGFNYATLADGVASANTLSGDAARAYMKAYADAKGTPLSDSAIDGPDGIVADMARGYLEKLKDIAETDPNGEVNRDINWQEAREFHEEGFTENGLAIDAWTLNEVFNLLGESADNQKYWDKVLDSAGDTTKELELAVETLGLMVYGVDNGDPRAAVWLSRMATWDGLKEMAANIPGMFNGINPNVYMYFKDAQTYLDPLVLDLDNDGIETVSNETGIKFDFDGDLTKTGTGWVKADDGILVLDRNGSGAIESGSELFGVDTFLSSGVKAANGFEALADLDTNRDGKFASDDVLFGNVKVWRDHNQDGISQKLEMYTLNELGILSIGVSGELYGIKNNSNIITNIGIYTRLDSQTGGQTSNNVGTIDFAQNTFVREFGTSIPLTDWAAALPDIRGSGTVRDLREATVLSTGLRQELTAFISSNPKADSLDRVLSEWADTGAMPSFSERVEQLGGQGADIRFSYTWNVPGVIGGGATPSADQLEKKSYLDKVQVLEAFTGVQYFKFSLSESGMGDQKQLHVSVGSGSSNGGGRTVTGSPHETIYVTDEQLSLDWNQKGLIDKAYSALASSVYEGLKVKSSVGDYLARVDYKWSDSGFQIDTSNVKGALANAHSKDPVAAIFDAIELTTVLRTGEWSELLSDWTSMLSADQRAQLIDLAHSRTGKEAVIIQPDVARDAPAAGFGFAYGSPDSNTYVGISNGTNFINGGEGNDTIYGGDQNDVLIGGLGQDRIYGNGGDDVIIDDGQYGTQVRGGEGKDTYILQGREGYLEIIEDGSITKGDVLIFQDIVSSEVKIQRLDNELMVYILGREYPSAMIQRFFKDGEPTNRLSTIVFADGVVYDAQRIVKESSIATEGPDRLYTHNKVNQVFGLGGSDELFGGSGDDYLDGGADTDWLYGGNGDDTLFGGTGDDQLYGGLGVDTYVLARNGGTDVAYDKDEGLNRIFVSEGINPREVLVSYHWDNSLYGMHVTLAGTRDRIWFDENSEVVFADGTKWDRAQLEARALLTSEYADEVYGRDADEVFDGLGGDDNIDGGPGSDKLYGSAGNDILRGGQGRDLLDGGSGADTLDGGEGDDWLSGGIGDDVYSDSDGHNTYVFGQGHDLMTVLAPQTSIELVGYKVSDLSFSRKNGDLLIQANDQQSSIKIVDFFYYYSNPERQEITFISGNRSAIYDFETITELLKVKTGTNADDRMFGTSDADIMYGMAGNDTIVGQSGNDSLYGGDGDDYLVSGDGDNYLDGGKGNGQFDLSGGNNIVFYAVGDGADTIYLSSEGTNTLVLGEPAKSDNLSFYQDDNRLIIRLNDDKTQQIEVVGFFNNPQNSFLGVRLADGTFINQEQITAQAILLPNVAQQPWTEYQVENWIFGSVGNDSVYGNERDNFMFGFSGQDYMAGGLGNDGYMVSPDLDTLTIKDTGGDNDILYFQNMSVLELSAISRKGDDLLVGLSNGKKNVVISDFFAGNDSVIEELRFSDGKATANEIFDQFAMG